MSGPGRLSSISGEFSAFDREMMRLCLDLARQAFDLGEVPVGAVVTEGERVLARAYNLREKLADPTAHAERLALTEAGRLRETWNLSGCTLYATLEPCAMCAGAIVQGRIERLVYGAKDGKAGACDSLYRLTRDHRLNHQLATQHGLMAHECGQILTDFFRKRRQA